MKFMNRRYVALASLALVSIMSHTAQATQTTTINISRYFVNRFDASDWVKTREHQIQSKLDSAVSASLPDFRGSADVTPSTRIANDGSGGYTAIISIHLDNPAYAFERTLDKFPGMTCGEAEVEGRRRHPHSFLDTYSEYREGRAFHRVRGCEHESTSIAPVAN